MSRPNFKPFNPVDKTPPAKPREDFPLFPHRNGCWAKKIRGKLHYFGVWSDPDAALAKYLKEKDDLHNGRTPRDRVSAGVVVRDICDAFLIHKEDKVNAGELSPHTWAKYKTVADLLVKHLGKTRLVTDIRPDDFARIKNAMSSQWGPLRVGDFIQHIRSVFKYAFDAEVIDRPVRFGPGFDRPSKQVIRRHKAKQGVKLFTADEVRRMIDAGGVQMRAMILLGINCGFGNADVGNLPASAVDLERGWINYPRPKTGVNRRCSLWPETVEAIRASLAIRPAPKGEADGLLFITRCGQSWAKEKNCGPLVLETRKLLKRLSINRARLGFYTLRHTFRTIADETRDQAACDHIMGHTDDSMAGHYRERIGDERLKAVSDHVRGWLGACGRSIPTQEPDPVRVGAAEG